MTKPTTIPQSSRIRIPGIAAAFEAARRLPRREKLARLRDETQRTDLPIQRVR